MWPDVGIINIEPSEHGIYYHYGLQDALNEAWENLLELIDTRTQMLAASALLHKFFHDCRDTLSRILVSK